MSTRPIPPLSITIPSEGARDALIILLNIELRIVQSDHLNGIFRQLVGRDHDAWARANPQKTRAPEPWYVKGE